MAQKKRCSKGWLIVFSLVFLSCSDEPYYFLEIDLDEQNQERIMRESYSELIYSERNFLDPMLLRATEKGIFVLDVGDSARVRRYNWEFELVNKIGRGLGSGPGEIGGVSNIHVSDDTLYFADVANALLHQYTIDNQFVRSISIENEVADQLITLGDTLVVRTTYSTERPLFINSRGKLLGKADPISTDETRYWWLLGSRLVTDGVYLYRVPVYFGFMVKYNITGTVISARHLVDSYAPPFHDRTRNPREQPVAIAPGDAVKVSVMADNSREKICVLRFYRYEGERFIDCYDTSDLAYLFSFVPPEGTRNFQIYENYFAAIHDSSLTVWEWNEK